MSNRQSRRAADSRSLDGEYELRWCRPSDAGEVHALLSSELDRRGSRDWFDWKYDSDPYVSHIPINVVEHEGAFVGLQGYLPSPVRSGDRTMLALQPVDAYVHPSHRRKGIYTELTQQAIDRYTDGEPALFFNYPNAGALGAQERLGWGSLGTLPVYYRVQRPSAFTGSAIDGRAGRALDAVADAVARGGFAVVDATAASTDGIDVTRHDDAPAEELASLYERHVPDRLHVHREPRFYEWWLDDPAHDFRTYVARSGREPVGAIVTRKPRPDVLQLRDAVPFVPAQSRDVFGGLLATVLRDNADVSVVKSVGETLPAGLLRRFGFVSDDAPVVGSYAKPVNMAARPLVDDTSDLAPSGTVTDRTNWHPTFLELDRD